MARLLVLEAHNRAHDGDINASIESLLTLLALGRTLDGYPNVTVHFARRAFDGMATPHLSQLIEVLQPNNETLSAIQSDLRCIDYQADLRTALIAERALMLDCYDEMLFYDTSITHYPTSKLFAPALRLKHVEVWSHYIDATHRPWHEVLSSDSTENDWRPSSVDPTESLVAEIASSLDQHFVIGARHSAHKDTLDTAIAVLLYYRDHGKLPTSLNELVPSYLPEVGLDPFDGEPLRYRAEAASFVAYSIGQNAIDDQGNVKWTSGAGYPDIGVHWKVPNQLEGDERKDRSTNQPSSSIDGTRETKAE